MDIKRVLFFLLFCLIYILPAYSLHRILLGYFNSYKISLFIMTISLLIFPLSNFLVRWRVNFLTSALSMLGGIILFVYTYLAIYLIIHMVIRFIPSIYVYKKVIFLSYLGIVFLLGIYAYVMAIKIRVTTYELTSSKVSKDTKILMFSDIHLSPISNKNVLKNIGKIIDNKKPDMILIAGDIIDTDAKVIRHDYSSDFSKIKAPLGVYASIGNHEYYGDLKRNLDYIKKMGVKLLVEQGLEVGDFFIIGRDYVSNDRKTMDDFKVENKNGKEIISMDHSPKDADNFIKSGEFLQVSGHTHHGQIFPFNFITKKMYNPSWGIRQEGKSTVITTCGVGYWGIPMRLPSQAEVVEIIIKKGE